jgi:chromosome partitioning protein
LQALSADSAVTSTDKVRSGGSGPVIVAFLNFKGGVGKTSNVVNLGACLAATHQKRVLLIDLDAQCNTSLWLLGKRALWRHTEEPARTITQAFQDKLRGTRLFRFSDAVVRGVPLSEKGYKLIPNLDLLPATVDLLSVEENLAHRIPQGGHRFLFEQTERHLAEYDYVLIDCAPNFFGLTKNAIFLGKHLAIPYIPDFLSLVGFQTLARLVEDFGQRIGGQRTVLGRTRISALILNRWAKVGNVFQQGRLELEKLTGDLKAQGLIHPATTVLEPPIRTCVKVAEAPAVHLPVLLHAPGSNGDTDYAALTQSFIQHYEGLK